MEHGAKALVPRASLLPSGLKSGGSRIYSGLSKGLLMSGADGDQRDSTTQARSPGTRIPPRSGLRATLSLSSFYSEARGPRDMRQIPRGHTASSSHRGAWAQLEQMCRGSFVAGKDATLR